ncbi:heterokaryon incompatibility protein [Seiridium cupressi]
MQPFQYAEEVDSASIRLLSFSDNILEAPGYQLAVLVDTYPIASLPVYHALSYTWGPPTHGEKDYTNADKISIEVNGGEFSVFPNLLDALMTLRDARHSQRYWIDAICINQDDTRERESQVGLMEQIYSKAARVEIWLGKAHSPLTTDLIRKTASLGDYGPILEKEFSRQRSLEKDRDESIAAEYGLPPFTDDVWKGLIHLFQRTWFDRAWVLQEIALSQDAVVLLEPDPLPWNDLVQCSWFLRGSGVAAIISKYQDDHNPINDSSPLIGQSAVTINSLNTWRSKPWDEFDFHIPLFGDLKNPKVVTHFLFIALVTCRRSRATDVRDKVYSLLGIIGAVAKHLELPMLHLKADYDPKSTSATVFTDATKVIIRDCDHLRILGCVGQAARKPTRDLPSWVPDFAEDNASNPIGSIHRTVNGPRLDAPKDRTYGQKKFFTDGNYLRVTGVQIGRIIASSESNPTGWTKGLKLLLDRAVTYAPTGQGRIEAFWRTMICDVDRFNHPLIREMGDSFMCWMAGMIIRGLTDDILSGVNPLTSLNAYRFIQGFEADQDADQMPSFAFVGECSRNAGFTPNDSGSVQVDTEALLLALSPGKLYEASAVLTLSNRGFFVTDEGHFGLGPKSLEVDDTVFIVSGCPTPLILRGELAEEGDSNMRLRDSRYELIGEAYVHGVMHGEAIGEDTEWVEICLV